MKNLNFKLMSTALAVIAVFSGCSKDEDTVKTNSFSFESKSYDTPKGFIEFYGPESDNKSANFDVFLASSEVIYDVASDDYNTGANYDYVYIELNSSSLTELVSGTYTYDNIDLEMDELAKPNTFSYSSVGVDVVDETVDHEYSSDETTTGTVTVNKSGTTYEITYSVKLEGKMVVGYYKGSLTAIDYSDEERKKSTSMQKRNGLGVRR